MVSLRGKKSLKPSKDTCLSSASSPYSPWSKVVLLTWSCGWRASSSLLLGVAIKFKVLRLTVLNCLPSWVCQFPGSLISWVGQEGVWVWALFPPTHTDTQFFIHILRLWTAVLLSFLPGPRHSTRTDHASSGNHVLCSADQNPPWATWYPETIYQSCYQNSASWCFAVGSCVSRMLT